MALGWSPDTVTVGPFTLEVPAGWQRGSAKDEAEAEAFLFHETGTEKPVVVGLLHEAQAFKSESERVALLKQLRDGLRNNHKDLKTDRMKLAGVDVERHRYVKDGQTVFILSPYNGEKVFCITVVVPNPDAPFPPSAERLLSTLKLAGPPYKPARRDLLDNLLREIDKLEQRVDEALATITGEGATKKDDASKTRSGSEAKPPAGGGRPGTEGPSKPTETSSSSTTQPVKAVAAFTLDRSGSVRTELLSEADRVWAPPVTKPVAKGNAPPVTLPPTLDIKPLASLANAGNAALALAALRELAGPLSPEDTARLDAKWAPYFRMPSEESEAYFAQLTPLLQETLELRTAAATAAAEFDAAWEEAVIAASYDSEEGVREALAIADKQRALLASIQTRMAELADRAAKLGPPPNPIEQHLTAQRSWQETLKTTRSLVAPPQQPKGAWVLKRIRRTDKKPEPEGSGVRFSTVMSDQEFRYEAVVIPYEILMGGAMQQFSGEYVFHVRWSPMPRIIAGGSTATVKFNYSWHYRGNDDRLIRSEPGMGIYSDVFVQPDPKDRTLRNVYYPELFGFERGYNVGLIPPVGSPDTGTSEVRFVAPEGKPGAKALLTVGCDIHKLREDSSQVSRAQFYRIFEYVWTTDPNEIAKAGQDVEEVEGGDEDPRRAETLAFHERNILLIRRNIERDREELARETDPARRAVLEMRILAAESDLMAEEDLITSIKTGEIVHRRTPFEDFAHDRFVQSIREQQVQMEQFQRATAALQRLAGMLPPGEAEEARRFIDRQLSGGVLANQDFAAVRRIAEALSNKVQGYIEAERAKAQLDEAAAEYGLETAERLKSAADKGMFVCSIFGGRGVMIAYQAATGYVEGGPQEAILRTASWVSTPTYIAAEAFRGYHRVDENGEPAGWKGAATDAAKAYVLAKLFEYGASKAKQWVTGRGPAGLTAAERMQMAEFQRLRTAGELQAREFARLQADLERAARQGASPDVITRLQNQVRRAAAAIHANPHAKNYLKYRGDIHTQRAYNAHMRANHAEVEARFHERMAQRGWNRQPLREFRNAASGDSVGMDHDIGLDEAAATTLRKNGRPASLWEWNRDAQQAWDEAYAEVTGQSAARSWETVTTSAHAEAYRDLNWLCHDKSGIQRVWGQQAADVTRYKNWHLLNDPNLDPLTALQEVSRGTAKDISTKLTPLLNRARPANPQSAQALERARRQWNKVQSILEAFGNNTIDPITASRRIREVTGKDITEVVDDAAMMIESLAKHVGN